MILFDYSIGFNLGRTHCLHNVSKTIGRVSTGTLY